MLMHNKNSNIIIIIIIIIIIYYYYYLKSQIIFVRCQLDGIVTSSLY